MLVHTKSFQISIYLKGDQSSSKLAFVLPGKLDTKDYPHMRSHVDFLAKRGYLALSFDPPGTWESPGNISLYTMTNYLKAINELIEYFGNKTTFVLGHSRGGSMAMLSAIINPSIFSYASIMSFYSFKPRHSQILNTSWKFRGYELSKRDLPNNFKEYKVFKLPYSFYEDQIQYDMLDGLKQSKKPKLFIYGKNDTTVSAEIIKTAYNEASTPKEIYEINSDHDYRYHPRLIDEVNNIIGIFLDKWSN